MGSQLTQQEQQKAAKEVRGSLQKMRGEIASALPKHLDADRLCRIVLTEVRKTPKLLECHRASLFGAIMQSSQLGLEIGSSLGHAYLVPYKNECQFIIGYRGMIDLARRSGQIQSLCAHEVYENDLFEFEYGLQEKLRHVPTQGEKGFFKAVYAVAHLKDGGHQMEVMFRNEVDEIKSCSSGAYKDTSPWNKYYPEMAKKTVIRRLFKYLPVSVEFQKAIKLDEDAEVGKQENEFFVETQTLDDKTETESKNIEQIAQKVKSDVSNNEEDK